MTTLWGVVPAAGIGQRMGPGAPKQQRRIGGATLLEHSVRALLSHPDVQGVMVALHVDDQSSAREPGLQDARVHFCVGGASRSASVALALAQVAQLTEAEDDVWVLVHDAARPCLPAQALHRLVDAVLGSGEGAILAQPVTDTVKQVDARGRVEATLDRDRLWRAQTPQMFALDALRTALESAHARNLAVTDEAAAMELAGLPVSVVEGPACNVKVTRPEDLEIARQYLEQSSGAAS